MLKKTNLLLAVSITALLSGCGGGSSTPAPAPAPAPAPDVVENSAMQLPDNIVLAKEADSANLAFVNYAAFNDAGTDYSNQSQDIWLDDGEYEPLNIVNGVMKIMTFTKAAEMANKGTYKILFNDPFADGTSKQSAYINATRADTNSTTPLLVNFYLTDEVGTRRLIQVTINSGVSATQPMGDFKMNMILLDDEDYSAVSLDAWETAAKAHSDPFFQTMQMKVSPDASVANQTNIQFDMLTDGRETGEYNNVTYNKQHLAANIKATGSMDSGHGWLLDKMAIDDNEYTYFDELYPAFDGKYIADRVGRTVEGDEHGGLLSHRSTFNSTNYVYKLFDTDGSNIDTGNTISSFGFKDGNDNYGWIGANYLNDSYSASYYFDTDLSIDDEIYNYSENATYTVTAVDTTNKLVDLKNASNTTIEVGTWSQRTIDGLDYYQNSNKLFPSWVNGAPNQITGTDVTIGSVNYKVKPIVIQKKRATIGEDGDYAQLKNLAGVASDDIVQVGALTDKLFDLDSITQESGLPAFTTSLVNDTYIWFRDHVKDKESTIPLRVVDGIVIVTE